MTECWEPLVNHYFLLHVIYHGMFSVDKVIHITLCDAWSEGNSDLTLLSDIIYKFPCPNPRAKSKRRQKKPKTLTPPPTIPPPPTLFALEPAISAETLDKWPRWGFWLASYPGRSPIEAYIILPNTLLIGRDKLCSSSLGWNSFVSPLSKT